MRKGRDEVKGEAVVNPWASGSKGRSLASCDLVVRRAEALVMKNIHTGFGRPVSLFERLVVELALLCLALLCLAWLRLYHTVCRWW